ncbi:unnamed protein product [Dimorphilus gyrociliatus]|uniref:Uncharacterized protein n=1 Tax=Dimorphilus gyrociliatus TaxID=2664684 RepID=A0A7I8V9A6_9ANNE|nr:unnamed protein product [Dimorphilus gyrociliatus]
MTAQIMDPIYFQSNGDRFYYYPDSEERRAMLNQQRELFKPWRQFSPIQKRNNNGTFYQDLNKVTSDIAESVRMMKYWAMYLPKRPINGLLKSRKRVPRYHSQLPTNKVVSRCEGVHFSEDQVTPLEPNEGTKKPFYTATLEKNSIPDHLRQKEVSVLCLYKARRSKYYLEQRKKEEEIRKNRRPVWQTVDFNGLIKLRDKDKFKSASNYLPSKKDDQKNKSLRSKSVVEVSRKTFTLPQEASIQRHEKGELLKGSKTIRSSPRPQSKGSREQSPVLSFFNKNIQSIPIIEKSKSFHKLIPSQNSFTVPNQRKPYLIQPLEKSKTELPTINSKKTVENNNSANNNQFSVQKQGTSSCTKLNLSLKPSNSNLEKKITENIDKKQGDELYNNFQHVKFNKKQIKENKKHKKSNNDKEKE